MSELKYLNGIESKVNEEIGKHPAFLDELQKIDNYIGAIHAMNGYSRPRYEINVSSNQVEVSVFYSYGEFSEDRRSRSCQNYSISLDEVNNLVCEESLVGAFGYDNASYEYELQLGLDKKVVEKGSENVLSKKSTHPIIEAPLCPSNSEFLIPLADNNYYNFEATDATLKNQLKKFDYYKRMAGNFVEWEAVRTSETTARTSEYYVMPYSDGEKLIVFQHDVGLTGPDYSSMRIDNDLALNASEINYYFEQKGVDYRIDSDAPGRSR